VLDDREVTEGEVQRLIGARRFGDIVYKRSTLYKYLTDALPKWAKHQVFHLRDSSDLESLRTVIESYDTGTAVCIIASRSGFDRVDLFTQFIERLPYAAEDFTDRLYNPLVVFFRNAHNLIDQWANFSLSALHTWDKSWQNCQRLESLQPLDLGNIRDFLHFTSGWTQPRYFNEMTIDTYYYKKSSSEKIKIQSEYLFYSLVPERMRPWLVETFDYRDEGERASYRMLRYYLADAALQWVHGAFDAETFERFLDRLLFFIADRPRKSSKKENITRLARELFVKKVELRINQFLALGGGRRINQLASSAAEDLDISYLLNRYIDIFNRFEKHFSFEYCVIGHGDPCFSNILYDQQRHLLKLVDPKGALTEDDLWTHPLYDLCKISHSVLGDYDFINTGLYSVTFNDSNDFLVRFHHTNHDSLKKIFLRKIESIGLKVETIRLGEASLFLSMLPFHIDSPSKVLAFILIARQILNEVDNVHKF
jgi:hypothetical protein